jgi:Tfp pilus assembly protein PilO
MALPIKPSRNALIGLICAIVFVLAACGFTYYNRASRLHDLQAQIQDKKQKLVDSRKIVEQLSRTEQNYLDAQAKLGTLEQGVSTKAYVPTLLRQLEELGKNVNLKVAGVRPMVASATPAPANDKSGKAKKKVDPYDKLDLDIQVKGKYWDVVRFVYEITSFPKIIEVKDMQISPVAGDNNALTSPLLAVRLSTTAFILKEPLPVKIGRVETETGMAGERT